MKILVEVVLTVIRVVFWIFSLVVKIVAVMLVGGMIKDWSDSKR